MFFCLYICSKRSGFRGGDVCKKDCKRLEAFPWFPSANCSIHSGHLNCFLFSHFNVQQKEKKLTLLKLIFSCTYHSPILHFACYLQSQLATFRSYEGQDMYVGDKIIPIKVPFINKVLTTFI